MTKDNVKELFYRMNNWRHLPKYQLERRADLFFTLYIEDVLKEKGFYVNATIIPEFPLRKGTILGKECPENQINRSYNIDYFVLSTDRKTAFFLELKTDPNSITVKQKNYIKQAKKHAETEKLSFIGLLNGIIELSKATNSRSKYYYLLKELEKLNLISSLKSLDDIMDKASNSKKIPRKDFNDAIDKIDFKTTVEVNEIKLLYIQPTAGQIDEEIEPITFANYIQVLEKQNDNICEHFSKSLEKWSKPETGFINTKTSDS